ncbi:MAG: PQQ-binding-like beta-propeller repeat protein [Planctomycetota bacterium]
MADRQYVLFGAGLPTSPKLSTAGLPKRQRNFPLHRLGSLFLLIATSFQPVSAGDWPQILGVNRNGIAVDEKLADSLPAGGPVKVWQAEIGSGFAGVAVADQKLVLFHRLENKDTLTAYNAETGKELWSQGFETNFVPQIVPDDGPRAVPTIHKDRVYALAPNGGLYCVDMKTGKPLWQRQTQKEFNALAGYFGSGSSPLVEGKLLIVNVGGDKAGAGMVAFDLETGKTEWKSVNDQASYSSPIAVTVSGTRHLLCLTRLNFVSLDPMTGEERFRTPFGQRGPTVNAAIPILMKNQVLLTASYGIGAELLTIQPDKVEVAWNDEVLASQYTTPIVHDGMIYGVDGRQDGGAVTLKCFDPQSRKVAWTQTTSAYATLIAADGKLLVMHTNGLLKIVDLNKKAYREIASAQLLPGTTRALPALANGRLYVRNDNTLKCVSLAK